MKDKILINKDIHFWSFCLKFYYLIKSFTRFKSDECPIFFNAGIFREIEKKSKLLKPHLGFSKAICNVYELYAIMSQDRNIFVFCYQQYHISYFCP